MSPDGVEDEKPIDPGGATVQSSHDSGAFTVPAAANNAADPIRVTPSISGTSPKPQDDEQFVIERAPNSDAASIRCPIQPAHEPPASSIAEHAANAHSTAPNSQPPNSVPEAPRSARPTSLLHTTAPPIHASNPNSEETLRVGGGAGSNVPPPKVAPPVVAPPVFEHHSTSIRSNRSAPTNHESAASPPTSLDNSDAGSPLRRFLFTYSNWRRAVSVSARKLEMPAMCACCSGKADSSFEARYVRTSGVRVVRSTGYVWAFPYCTACLKHVRRAELSRTISLSAGGSAFALVALAAFTQGWVVAGLIVAAIAGAAAWFAARKWQHARLSRMMWADCACFGPAVRYDEFKGTLHRFSFANPRYAAAFERANENKIVGAAPP